MAANRCACARAVASTALVASALACCGGARSPGHAAPPPTPPAPAPVAPVGGAEAPTGAVDAGAPARQGRPTTGWYDGAARVTANTCDATPATPPIVPVQLVTVTAGGVADAAFEAVSPAGHATRAALPLVAGATQTTAYAAAVHCDARTKSIGYRVIATTSDGFDVERTVEYGDTSSCPATTPPAPVACRVVALYTFTRRPGPEGNGDAVLEIPPPPAGGARATLAACDVPLRHMKGPWDETRISVRIRARIPYEAEAERCLDRIAPGAWQRLERRFPGITMHPTFSSVPSADLEAMMEVARQRSGQAAPDLMLWFTVEHPRSVNADALVAALQKESFVAEAYKSHRTVVAGSHGRRRPRACRFSPGLRASAPCSSLERIP